MTAGGTLFNAVTVNAGFVRGRSLPLSVRLTLLFGGVLQPVGWFFFGFGMFLVWVFVGHADLSSFWRFRGDLERVPGVVKRTPAPPTPRVAANLFGLRLKSQF